MDVTRVVFNTKSCRLSSIWIFSASVRTILFSAQLLLNCFAYFHFVLLLDCYGIMEPVDGGQKVETLTCNAFL